MEEKMRKREKRPNEYIQLHWTRVLRCLKEGKIVVPNPIIGNNLKLEDDLEKIGDILASLYEMGVLTKKEYHPALFILF